MWQCKPTNCVLPTLQEVARYAARWSAPMRRLSSPFFISTLQDGSLVPGLDGVPGAGCKGPIIFVGNHQVRRRLLK